VEEGEPLGFVIALPPECRSLTPYRVRRGDIVPLNDSGWIAVSGAGPANASAAATALVERGARRLVSWGCAAALADGLSPGDLILPSHVRHADGTTARLASPWRDRLVNCLRLHGPVTEGVLAESPGIVASAAEKRAVHEATGAVAMDMETGAVVRTATSFGIPSISVRTIADTAATAIPGAAQAALNPDGEIVVSGLLLQLAQHPSDIIPLIRLFRCFQAAVRALKNVAALAGPTLDP